MELDVTALIVGALGLVGVLATQFVLWRRQKRQRAEQRTIAEMEDDRERRRDELRIIQTLRDRLDKEEANADELRQRLWRTQSELGSAHMEVRAARAENEKLANRVADLATEVNEHRRRLEALEAARVNCLTGGCEHREGCDLIETV